MAHMIPPKPKNIPENCNEGVIFHKLERGLCSDFYVFHSVKEVVTNVKDEIFEREMDFVIAHKDYGILCIESKGGENIFYSGRNWYYSSGDPMDHDGPYNQITGAMRTLRDKIKSHRNPAVRALLEKCKLYHAVMFADMSRTTFENEEGWPEEADPRITIFTEDMISIEKKIKEIFNLKQSWEKYQKVKITMTDSDFKLLLNSVLCPSFNVVPSPMAKNSLLADNMNQLLHEQYVIFDFLDEQKTAVINGAAGTGKTMLAVHKARMHSENGEKVLFLCYNRLLCEHLVDEYLKSDDKDFNELHKNIDFMTISKLAKKVTGNYKNFEELLEWLLECADKKKELGYQHIIVDEGQDFGLVDAEIEDEQREDTGNGSGNCSIIDALQEAAQANNGTFYLFYDKYQMIQGIDNIKYSLPYCIENSDCRLTLHKNCRNTAEIAATSVTPLRDQKNRAIKPTTACSWETPYKPVMHLLNTEDEVITVLNNVIDKLRMKEIGDIVIITPKTLTTTCIVDCLEGTNDNTEYIYNGNKYRFTTCKKFKGLEADAIIMIDLDKNSFTGKRGNAFYVGTSRAKLHLDIICDIKEEDYSELVKSLDSNALIKKNPERMRKILGNVFGADIII